MDRLEELYKTVLESHESQKVFCAIELAHYMNGRKHNRELWDHLRNLLLRLREYNYSDYCIITSYL